METEANISKGRWANQYYEVAINRYDYSPENFRKYFKWLKNNFICKKALCDTITGMIVGDYWAECKIDGVKIMMKMDNWTFSIATETEEMRDKIYTQLIKS